TQTQEFDNEEEARKAEKELRKENRRVTVTQENGRWRVTWD
nr:Chain A, EHEE_rd1_0284 [Escherichia coli]